jgi:hypothetical protein
VPTARIPTSRIDDWESFQDLVVARGDVLTLEREGAADFATCCPEQYEELVESPRS